MRGKFITFEGGEGTGKSTQAAMLALRLEALGLAVHLTREPGGSPGAEIIRHVLLSGAAKPFGPDVEAMLFAAARDDHVRCAILPALNAGNGSSATALPIPRASIKASSARSISG